MTPSGVEQDLRASQCRLGVEVNPTMTPSGVEQGALFSLRASHEHVNPTMTPSGVEQLPTGLWTALITSEPDDDALGR